MQVLLTVLQKKISVYLPIFQERNFKVTIANNFVLSFEQLGPDI